MRSISNNSFIKALSSSLYFECSPNDTQNPSPLLYLITEPHLLAACLTTVGSQLAQTKGCGHSHPLLCAGFLFSNILFAVLLGLFIFDEPVTPTLMIGLAIMMVAESGGAWLEYRRTRQAHKLPKLHQTQG